MFTYALAYDDTHDVTALDKGGAYVDLYSESIVVDPRTGVPYIAPSDWNGDPVTTAPFDTINVYDYRAGHRSAEYPFGATDYAALIAAHLADEDEER